MLQINHTNKTSKFEVVPFSEKDQPVTNTKKDGWVFRQTSPTTIELVWDIASMTGHDKSCAEWEVKTYQKRSHKNTVIKLTEKNGEWEITELVNYDTWTECLKNSKEQLAEIKEIIAGWQEYLTLGSTSSKLLVDRMGATETKPENVTPNKETTNMNKIALIQGKLVKFADKNTCSWLGQNVTIANLAELLGNAAFPEKDRKDASLLFELVSATELKVVMNLPSFTVEGVENTASLSNQGARQHQNAVVTASYSASRGEWIASNITWNGGSTNTSLKIFKDAFNKSDVLVAELNELSKGWQDVLTNGSTASTVLQERYGAPKVGAKVATKTAETKNNNVTAEKEGQKKMSNGISVKDFIGSPKAEAANAMWRVAAGSAVDLVRDPLIEMICTQMGVGKNKLMRNKIALFLATGFGRGVVAMLLSLVMPGINMMMPDDMKQHTDRLAKELREHGYEHLMLPLAALVTGPIKDQLVTAIQGVSMMQKLQGAVATGEESESEAVHEELVKNTVKAQA
jgi:hypothetical protein